jgi:hypothetical protein
MTIRSESHKIADIAVNAVERVFSALGWASERIEKDYGEDLLVQPTLRNKVEYFRIWVQVKGTRDLKRFQRGDKSISISVASGTALRWARSADPVCIIVWDVTRGEGVWAWAADSVDEWDTIIGGAITVQIHLDPQAIFTSESALKMGRVAYIRHYNRLIMEIARPEVNSLTTKERKLREEVVRGRVVLLVAEVLRELDIWKADGDLNPTMQEQLRKGFRKGARGQPKLDKRQVGVLVFLNWVHRKWGIGVPTHLLIACTNFIVDVYKLTTNKSTKKILDRRRPAL